MDSIVAAVSRVGSFAYRNAESLSRLRCSRVSATDRVGGKE